jgi:hypothetical protein
LDAIGLAPPAPLGRWHEREQGFDLHAGVVVPAGARDRLERLCRYALRPAVGQDRLQVMPNGEVVLELGRRWSDGTTHLIFGPTELLQRLAALVPRPRINLVLYHGVLAPRAAWRRKIVPAPAAAASRDKRSGEEGGAAARRVNRPWAELMARAFGFDVLACPRCPGRLTLVALIRAPAVVTRILTHLGLSMEVPSMRPARAPPLPLDEPIVSGWPDD